MFTQCAKCETVFRLSAEVLRAAGGQVRCGRCGDVFNALARLAEDANAFPTGESPLEMEERADEILHSTVPPLTQTGKPADDPEELSTHDVEFARLQVLEKFIEDQPPAEPPAPAAPAPAAPSPAAQVPKSAATNKPSAANKPAAAGIAPPPAKGVGGTPPAGAPVGGTPPAGAPLRRTPPGGAAAPSAPSKPKQAPAPASKPPEAGMPATGAPAASKPKPPASDLDGETSLEFTLPPGELDRIFVDVGLGQRKSPGGPPPAPAEEPAEAAEIGDAARNRLSGLEVSDDVRREMLLGISEPLLPDISTPRRRELPRPVWQGAAVVLALTLLGQLIHGNREWVGTHAPLRGVLHGLYSAFGVALPAPATLSAYQLRQWGVTGEPGASGTLRVRASILNTAAQLQPYPLLRVTLANRFGTRIGARDFEAAEYMGKPTVRLLAPGERVDATLDIVDPGKDAEGFEIDVCLRGVDQRISCAGDVAAQSKK